MQAIPAGAPRWERRANYVKSAIRTVGGHLRVIGDTLVFSPNAADRALFAKDWAVQLTDIEGIGVEPRSLKQVWAGGLRARLAIDLRDGRRALFVVSDLEEVVAELHALARLEPYV